MKDKGSIATMTAMRQGSIEDILPPLPNSSTHESKKHALYCKRSYVRKVGRMQNMRRQLQQLEAQFAQLLSSSNNEPSKVNPQIAAYQDVTAMKEALAEENKQLKKLEDEYREARRKVEILTQDLLSLPSLIKDGSLNATNIPFQLKQPLTSQDCFEMALKQYTELLDFQASNSFPEGIHSFGWHDRGMVNAQGDACFHLSKYFGFRSAKEDSRLVFQMNTDPVRMVKHPSIPAGVDIRFSIAQIVDDNNIIMCNEIFDRSGKRMRRAAYVTHRFDISTDEFYLFYTRLDPSYFINVDPITPEDQWNPNPRHHQEWTVFRQDEFAEDGYQMTYCVRQNIPHGVSPQHVLLGGFLLVLRTETWAYGPPVTLTWE